MNCVFSFKKFIVMLLFFESMTVTDKTVYLQRDKVYIRFRFSCYLKSIVSLFDHFEDIAVIKQKICGKDVSLVFTA